MNKKRLIPLIAAGSAVVVAGTAATVVLLNGSSDNRLVIEGKFNANSAVEYTAENIQFPLAHVENKDGDIVSYDVEYSVVNTKTNKTVADKYATFDLKVGEYKLIYQANNGDKLKKEIPFTVTDTQKPTITFSEIPNGLFLQDLDLSESQKLPIYLVDDASVNDGIELERKLSFKSADAKEFTDYDFREINNSYMIGDCGVFRYEVTATDAYGNHTEEAVEWRVKDRTWKPDTLPQSGILADYSVDGYSNYVDEGDANQWYRIGNDYRDEWLDEYEGAHGVMKIDMGFNESAGYGNNAIKLYFARNFTTQDIKGKYLAVRMRVEAKNIKDNFLFAGNNVAFRKEDETTRAFSCMVDGLKTDEWVTYYIDADTVEHIGMYPDARYNESTTFYEGGKPAECLQLCFSRPAGYYGRMTLYLDSISLAEKLPATQVTVSGGKASWQAVSGAEKYLVNISGKEQTVSGTSVSLGTKKGYVRVTPLGDGVLTLNGEEATAVFGLTLGKNTLAAFDDPLYADMFTDHLKFSSEAEHAGYRPQSFEGKCDKNGMTLDLGTGEWGVVSGIRMRFPESKQKGKNTTLRIKMQIENAKYRVLRVYDYDGNFLQAFKLTAENTGKYSDFDIDLSGVEGSLSGLQFIFGPSENMISVPEGVKIQFKDISMLSTYYDINIDGKKYSCIGERVLTPGYTANTLVQFTEFFNFGVPSDNTPLSFKGTLLLDGRTLTKGEYSWIGYKGLDTICLNTAHRGKVLTVKAGSLLYYGGKAVKVGETFNMKWNGSAWIRVANVPAAPKTQYITVDGEKKVLLATTALTPGYTTKDLVQFINVCDFGVPSDNTPFSFKGTILLDGKKVTAANWIGYKENTTVCLNVPHSGKLLTIKEGAVLYYGNKAVKVGKTFNMKWDGKKWVSVSSVPATPGAEYITVDGKKKELVGTVALQPGYTAESLVQFTGFYDFGVPADNTQLSFGGEVLLEGVAVKEPYWIGYPANTTVCLNIPHKGKVLTVKKGAVLYYGEKAVKVSETFNMKWDGKQWVAVKDIPTPPVITKTTVAFTYSSGNSKMIQVKTDLDKTTPCVNFLTTDNGCSIDESENLYQHVGWVGMANDSAGAVYLAFNFNSAFESGQTYYLPKGAVFGFTDGHKYKLASDYTFTFDGTDWTMTEGKVEPPPSSGEGTLNMTVSYSTSKLIQFETDLPSNTPCVNFLTTDNGCQIEQPNGCQQVGWIGMVKGENGKIYLSFNFNNAFNPGDMYFLAQNSLFSFTDNKKYKLSSDFILLYDGSGWMKL